MSILNKSATSFGIWPERIHWFIGPVTTGLVVHAHTLFDNRSEVLYCATSDTSTRRAQVTHNAVKAGISKNLISLRAVIDLRTK